MPNKSTPSKTTPRKVKNVRKSARAPKSSGNQQGNRKTSKKKRNVVGAGTKDSLKSKSRPTLTKKGKKAPRAVPSKKSRATQKTVPSPSQRAKVQPSPSKSSPPKRVAAAKSSQSRLKLSDRYPIFLFPVRLETKFMANGKELWVRIFPDDIVIETHEGELTKGEVLAGRRLLFEFQKARVVAAQTEVVPLNMLKSALGNNWDVAFQALPEDSPKRVALLPAYSAIKKILEEEQQQKKAAWRELATEFGPERAVWISRQVPSYKNKNLENLREDEWTSAAKVRVFPDYFEFHLYDENDQIIDKYITKGKRIPDELPLMADGQESTSKDEKEALILEFFNTVQSVSELMGRLNENVDSRLWKAAHTVFSRIATNVINSRNRQTKSPPFQSIAEIGRFWPKALLNQASQNVDGVEAFYALFIKNFENSLFDAKALWLEDFNAAVNTGMAVKINLTDVPPPFKRIIAVGVKESLNETASTKLLEELFENHRFTEGLGFLEPGTPTNNTKTVKSGHSESTEDYDRIFDNEFGIKNELNEDKLRDARRWGNRLKKYLGFEHSSTVFHRCEHAEGWEDSYQEYMNGLFWGITGEYFLKVFLGRHVSKSPGLWRNVRQHVRHYVRPLGLFPTVRIGNLPYGVLPVTNTPNWTPLSNSRDRIFDRGFSSLLKKLLLQWIGLTENSDRVPRIGNSANPESDPTQDLLQILGMEPSALSYTLRLYSDRRFLEWWALEIAGKSSFAYPVLLLLTKLYLQLIPWQKEMAESKRSLEALGGQNPRSEDPLLLRLWGWDDESEYVWENPIPFALRKDNQDSQTPLSVFGHLKDIIESRLNSQKTSIPDIPDTLLYKFLQETDPDEILKNQDLEKLLELDHAHTRLWLEKLFLGFLDISSHRLDAWITSLAHKRLEEMRRRYNEGIYLGAYGCLENLSPNPKDSQSKTTRANKVNVEGGYIHAPSLNHASAAAVLRNAFLTYEGREESRPFAINMTSTRIRRACRVLSGIREGQPLAALLGYQIERSLHDKQLDQYINVFRAHYPFPEPNEGPSSPRQTSSTESIKPRNVLNGLKLVQGIRLGIQRGGTTKSNVLKKIGVSNLQSGDGPRLLETLSEACDAIDAITDLLLNESIFQWVQGKFEHAGAALQAMSGQAKPPEVESIKTPVTGVSAQHRVLIIFSHENSSHTKPTLNEPVSNIRGVTEPILDHWFGALIGSTEKISCRVKFKPLSGRPEGLPTATDLQMYPLDLLYLSKFGLPEDNDSTGEKEVEENPTEQWIRSAVRSIHELSPDSQVDIDFDATRETGHRTFRQVFQLAQQVRKLFGQGRSLTPEKWVRPEEEDAPVVKDQWKKLLQELKARSQGVIRDQIDNLLDKLVDQKQTKIQQIETLMRVMRVGVMGVIPSGSVQEDQTILNTLRKKAFDELTERKAKYTQLVEEADLSTSAELNIERLRKEWHTRQEALQALFGKDFIIIPQCWVPNPDEVQKALKKGIYPSSTIQATPSHQDAGSTRIWTWFHQVAQTHPRLRQLEDTLMYLDAWNVSTGSQKFLPSLSLKPQIAQLPFSEKQHWIGLSREEIKANGVALRRNDAESADDEEEYPRGAVSIMAFSSKSLDLNKHPIGGVFIDAFSEVIPHADAQTGVAFQYDQPNSQPPHACLLAVPSQWGGKSGNQEAKWSLEEVGAVVKETMDLAKIRAVDFDALGKWQTLVPGLFLPVLSHSPGPPTQNISLFLDLVTEKGPNLGRILFLGRFKKDVPEIQIASRKQNIIKHKLVVRGVEVPRVGLQFSNDGFEITPKWPFKKFAFHLAIKKLLPTATIPESFRIDMTLFNPQNGEFNEKTKFFSMSKENLYNTGIFQENLEVSSDQRIVQIRIKRTNPNSQQIFDIILQKVQYSYWP